MILVTSRYSSARRRLLAPADKVRPRVFVPPEGFGFLVSPFVDLVKPREELVEYGLFHAHGMIENVEVEQAPFFARGTFAVPPTTVWTSTIEFWSRNNVFFRACRVVGVGG